MSAEQRDFDEEIYEDEVEFEEYDEEEEGFIEEVEVDDSVGDGDEIDAEGE